MDDSLYNLLASSLNSGKDVYYSWWTVFQREKDAGTLYILQLFTDMTGFSYSFENADMILLKEDAHRLLEEKIYKAPFEKCDIMEDGVFLANFNNFWHHIIVNQWKELLHENDWFNKSIMFAAVLANSNCEDCVMVGSFISAHFLSHLCMARLRLQNDMERVNCWRDNQRKSSLQKKQNYIDQICQILIPDIKHGLKYAKVATILMEQIFETIIAFPELIILEYRQIELLTGGLLWKNRTVVQTVLKCLKVLMMDSFSPSTKQTVALYILKTETQLARIMETFKTTESKILHLFLDALGVVGNIPLSEDTADKIVLKMFGKDETVVNAAIDLHGMYCAANNPPAEVETKALIAILDVFERYAYPLASFNTVIEKLWLKGFFRKFDGLFEMLSEAQHRSNAAFVANCIAHVINYCHQLLMEDIRMKVSPAFEPMGTVDWNFIRKRMDSFVSGYPKCLDEASSSPNLYNLLLNCLNPENNELYRVVNVDCEAYHQNVLFNILSKIALNGTSYTVLFHTLTSINNFDNVAHISEDVWKELTEKYYTFFFHTRSRLRRYNLGIDKKLMELYTIAITRLCVLIEINNMSENVFTLAEYLANDLRLLKKMNLSDEAEAIFYRLYKNALHAVVECCLDQPHVERPELKQLGKRVHEFMAELVEQLNCKDCSFAVGKHVANAVCNMLILTQETHTGVLSASLQQMTYSIEPEVLDKLSKYIERLVFVGKAELDEATNCLLAKKLMLVTYNDVYRLHLAIPQQKDTCHILKYCEENTLFSEELEQLLGIVFSNDRNEFYTVAAQVVVDYCKKSNFCAKVKKFLSCLHRFQAKNLPEENESDYSLNIIQHTVDKILVMAEDVNAIQPNKIKMSKLFDLMTPWAIQLPSDCRYHL
uniref:SCD domain-containing protein n=1 Tax=Anopheles culicifacies TaxID=139723 RepID=A0A182MAC2_9DIPT